MCVVLLGSFLVGTAGSQDAKPNVKPNIRRIAGNVYMVDESGPAPSGVNSFGHGNGTVLVGDDGLLIVDGDEFAGYDIRAVITEIQTMFDNKPIRYVIETACGGLAALSKKVATIIAADTARKRIAQKKCWAGYPMVLPTVTFESEMTLYFDGEEVQVVRLPTGKTDGDAMVYFKNANVVATGDTFISSVLPFYTLSEGGNILGVAEELRRIATLVPADAKVIPGHGPLASVSDILRGSKALDQLRDAIAAQMAKGKSLDQIKAMNLLAPWKDLDLVQPQSSYEQYFYERLSAPPDAKYQLTPDSDEPQ